MASFLFRGLKKKEVAAVVEFFRRIQEKRGKSAEAGQASNAFWRIRRQQAFLFFSFCVKAKSMAHYRGSSALMRVQQHSYAARRGEKPRC